MLASLPAPVVCFSSPNQLQDHLPMCHTAHAGTVGLVLLFFCFSSGIRQAKIHPGYCDRKKPTPKNPLFFQLALFPQAFPTVFTGVSQSCIDPSCSGCSKLLPATHQPQSPRPFLFLEASDMLPLSLCAFAPLPGGVFCLQGCLPCLLQSLFSEGFSGHGPRTQAW